MSEHQEGIAASIPVSLRLVSLSMGPPAQDAFQNAAVSLSGVDVFGGDRAAAVCTVHFNLLRCSGLRMRVWIPSRQALRIADSLPLAESGCRK